MTLFRNSHILPELSHFLKSLHGSYIYVTAEGRLGSAWELPVIDSESVLFHEKYSKMQSLLELLDPCLQLKIKVFSEQGHTFLGAGVRAEALQTLGYLNRRIIIALEYEPQHKISWKNIFYKEQQKKTLFETLVPWDILHRLQAKALDRKVLASYFFFKPEQFSILSDGPHASVVHRWDYMDFGAHVVGVVRIWKQRLAALEKEDLAHMCHGLELPCEMAVSLRKIPKTQADFRVRSFAAKHKNVAETTSSVKVQAAENILKDMMVQGLDIFEIEFLIILSRTTEKELREDLKKCVIHLRHWGEVTIENVGGAQSFKASLLGAQQHFTFLSPTQETLKWCPVFSPGEVDTLTGSSRELLMHRIDGSITGLDIFHPHYLAYNMVICGKTGSGKSVFTNLLTASLCADPHIKMIKIDVGGSSKKECQRLQGHEVVFDLTKPSGLNPFQMVSAELLASSEVCAVIVELLCTLVREEKETVITKQMRSDIERAYRQATSIRSDQNTCLALDTLLAVDHFPRKDLLRRWTADGVFKNALRSDPTADILDNPYTYFNFDNIQSAANKDFSEGMMAAVIAWINLKMLKMQNTADRLVMLCDETKFFIEKNATFFLLTTANFRKFGHSVILVAQNIHDFELSLENGPHKDIGILMNSPLRIIFSSQGCEDFLKDKLHLPEAQIHHIGQQKAGKSYRDAILQDEIGSKIVRMYLTQKEYWQYTSSFEDNLALNSLLKGAPHLTLEQAIACMHAS